MSFHEPITNLNDALQHLTSDAATASIELFESLARTPRMQGAVVPGPTLASFAGDTVVILGASAGPRILPTDIMRHAHRPLWFEAHINGDLADDYEVVIVTAVRTLGGRQLPRHSRVRHALQQQLEDAIVHWRQQHAELIASLRSSFLRNEIRNRLFELLQLTRRTQTAAVGISDHLAELTTDTAARLLYRQLRRNGLDPWDAHAATAALIE